MFNHYGATFVSTVSAIGIAEKNPPSSMPNTYTILAGITIIMCRSFAMNSEFY